MNSETTNEFFRTIVTTFLASIKSVGTACTLASVGFYLHQRGFVVGNGKRTLALISQQVTIPLLFFTKILYCNQDWSPEPCPNVTESLGDVWILLVWPVWVCLAGIGVGHFVTKLAMSHEPYSSDTERRNVAATKQQKNAILASIAFGNSTGLPITLLTVIHSNFGASSALGVVDPTLFLSVYLVLYPVLQWGIGGMLLAPPTNIGKDKNSKINDSERDTKIEENSRNICHTIDTNDSTVGSSELESDENNNDDSSADFFPNQTPGTIATQLSFKSSIRQSIYVELDRTKTAFANTKKSLVNNVIHNDKKMPEKYQIIHRGLDTTDASLYLSIPENLNRWGQPQHGNTSLGSGTNLFATDTTSENDILIGMDSTNKINQPLSSNVSESSIDGNIGMNLSERSKNPLSGKQDTEAPPVSYEICDSNNQAFATETSALISESRTIKNNIFLPSGASSTTSCTSSSSSSSSGHQNNFMATMEKILTRCFQPPVIAALLGLLFASFPVIRGILVDIEDRNGSAPLQWFFDGLFDAGRAAVPINMIILGCNLSAAYMLQSPMATSSATSATRASKFSCSISNENEQSNDYFSTKTTLLVVFGKMILMPVVGFTSTYLLSFIYTVPQEIAGSLYLVLTIVFLTPTANNVMVMVELGSANEKNSKCNSNSNIKESMAKIIACQYAIAPLVLSGTVTGAVLMAGSMARYSQPMG